MHHCLPVNQGHSTWPSSHSSQRYPLDKNSTGTENEKCLVSSGNGFFGLQRTQLSNWSSHYRSRQRYRRCHNTNIGKVAEHSLLTLC